MTIGPMTALPPRADAATLASIYMAALVIVPANLVVDLLPLSITPATFVGLGMAMCWVCAQLTTTLGLAKGTNPVRTALALFAISELASYGYAMYGYLPPDEIKSADQTTVLIWVFVGFTLLVCDGVRRPDRLDLLLQVVVVGCTFVAVVGALQFMVGFDLTQYLRLPGLRSTADYGYFTVRGGFRRPAGTTGTPIEFGVLCAMALPLALNVAFRAQKAGRAPLFWWACSLMIAAGAMYSVSRSAILGLASVFFTLLTGWSMRRRLWAVVVGLVFLVVIKFTADNLLGTIFSLFDNFSTDESVTYRTHDYPIAADLIARHPWLGAGWGTHYAPKHIIFDNQYLLVLVEGGVVGLAAFITLFVTAIVTALRIRFRATDVEVRDRALALIASLTVPAVGAITFDLLSFRTVTGLMFIVIGAIGCLYRITGPNPQPVSGNGPITATSDGFLVRKLARLRGPGTLDSADVARRPT